MNPKPFALQALVVLLVCNIVLVAAASYMDLDQLLLIGLGIVLALVAWFIIRQLSLGLVQPAPAPVVAPEPAPLPPPSDAPAIQMLSILQRKGRLIDFLQEDLSLYEDAQIGAAVRTIHEGCKQALKEYVTIEPIFSEQEGSQVTLDAGFDAHAVRLTGNIAGDPPFRGALRHRGWRVAKIDLPERVGDQNKEKILAAAEVEL